MTVTSYFWKVTSPTLSDLSDTRKNQISAAEFLASYERSARYQRTWLTWSNNSCNMKDIITDVENKDYFQTTKREKIKWGCDRRTRRQCWRGTKLTDYENRPDARMSDDFMFHSVIRVTCFRFIWPERCRRCFRGRADGRMGRDGRAFANSMQYLFVYTRHSQERDKERERENTAIEEAMAWYGKGCCVATATGCDW